MLDEVLNAFGVTDIFEINEPITYTVGNNLFVAVNTLGVMHLGVDLVEIKATKSYKIIVIGDKLECLMLNKSEVQVKGRINTISWEKL